MSTVERLEAAITKLEALRDASFEGPWHAQASGIAGGDHWYVTDEGQAIAHISANDGEDERLRQPTAVLIATLHATIEPQLAILRNALRISRGSWTGARFPCIPSDYVSVALADAILGRP